MILIISTCKHDLHEHEFISPLRRVFPEARVVGYKEIKDEYELADSVIISGTSLKDEDYLKHLDKFEFLRSYKKPVIGICAGAQIIALKHFGTLKSHKEIGLIHIKGKNPLPEEFEAYALHKNSIEESTDWEIIAKNDIVQGFKINNQIGLLFHPEVRNRELLKSILINLKK